MSIEEQRRTMVLTRVVASSLSMAQAALLLGLSERSIRRLKRRFMADGPAGLVHGNRGRSPARRLGDAVRARIVELAGHSYQLFASRGCRPRIAATARFPQEPILNT